MRGRVPGRPTKWLEATINQRVTIGKPGMKFEIWRKWKRTDKKLGTLTVSVGGLRWLPGRGKKERRATWGAVRRFFEEG